MPVTTIIKTYEPEQYKNANTVLTTSLSQLKAKTPDGIADFTWRNTDSALASFTMNLGNKSYSGWAFACTLPLKKGTALLLAYADAEKANDCQQFLLSVLDSFSIDNAALRASGPISTYAYPETDENLYTLNIADTRIPILMEKTAAEANELVIEREYAVLGLYAKSPLWKEAWQRYYRMIYRDSFRRLQKTAFSIYNALFPIAKTNNPEHAKHELASMLLKWTQSFQYEREKTHSDFENLPSIITGSGSDCDSRAMLLAVLLAQMHCKTMVFVSVEYSHALFGIAIEGEKGKQASIEVHGVSYLLGETTTNIDIGMVAKEMSDASKWIPILGI